MGESKLNESVFSLPCPLFKSLFSFVGLIGNVPVMLAKPQTFMNASGESVSKLP